MKQAYSKKFSVREKSLSTLMEFLAAQEQVTGRKDIVGILKATCQVLVKGFKDKVFSVSSYSGTPLFQHPEIGTPLYTVEPLYPTP